MVVVVCVCVCVCVNDVVGATHAQQVAFLVLPAKNKKDKDTETLT